MLKKQETDSRCIRYGTLRLPDGNEYKVPLESLSDRGVRIAEKLRDIVTGNGTPATAQEIVCLALREFYSDETVAGLVESGCITQDVFADYLVVYAGGYQKKNSLGASLAARIGRRFWRPWYRLAVSRGA